MPKNGTEINLRHVPSPFTPTESTSRVCARRRRYDTGDANYGIHETAQTKRADGHKIYGTGYLSKSTKYEHDWISCFLLLWIARICSVGNVNLWALTVACRFGVLARSWFSSLLRVLSMFGGWRLRPLFFVSTLWATNITLSKNIYPSTALRSIQANPPGKTNRLDYPCTYNMIPRIRPQQPRSVPDYPSFFFYIPFINPALVSSPS